MAKPELKWIETPGTTQARTLAGLRAALAARQGAAVPQPPERLLPTGIGPLDLALGGGFPRGIIATLEGPMSSGRSSVAFRLAAGAQTRGLIAAIDDGTLFAPAIAAAGVALDRLVTIDARDPIAIARSADIVLRCGAFSLVLIPALTLSASAWTRLGMLAHRSGTLLLALGASASNELAYFASLRVGARIDRVHWEGASGVFCTLTGYDVRADVLKHKRAAPGKHAVFFVRAFEGFSDADHLRIRPLLQTHNGHARSPALGRAPRVARG